MRLLLAEERRKAAVKAGSDLELSGYDIGKEGENLEMISNREETQNEL